ncbi:MAG: dual specificity protein phosphatase family protein [Candidatus Poseidonia sp.]|nr:dual specificity protein phosphatase family protein [Poseidonia sp.]
MRNSTTHPLYVSWVELEGDEGALGLTLCPGKYQPIASTGSWDRQLDVDVQALVDMGVSRLISLITKEDMQMLRVTDLPGEVAHQGLAWDHLPLPDTTAPTQSWMDQANPVLNHIIGTIPAGAKVVVHCMGGLSRAGTFASLYLWMRGMDMRDAIKTVREIRSPHAMNSRQVAFLMRMANGHDGALYESEGSV